MAINERQVARQMEAFGYSQRETEDYLWDLADQQRRDASDCAEQEVKCHEDN